MSKRHSRRDFLRSAGVTPTVLLGRYGVVVGAQPGRRPIQQLTSEALEAEIRRRADHYLAQNYLMVDYYRIRRRLAYPLPVRALSIPSLPVPSISDYPWSIWMTWELEERIHSLGWAAEWLNDFRAREAASHDLQALADWPRFRQYDRPDLSAGHAGRMLWAATRWSWASTSLRNQLRAGCTRLVDEILPESTRIHGRFRTSEAILAEEEPHRLLHNIPLIGTIGASLCASAVGHESRAVLNERIRAILQAILDLRSRGYTEGVCYDGYILDFAADWLHTLEPEERRPLLEHPGLPGFLEESYRLGAPGAAEDVAQLSDVEPREMPFHFSAQAKLYDLEPDGLRGWHLKRWRMDWIPAAALGVLHPLCQDLRETIPAAEPANVLYAVNLRSGWEEEDLAAMVSCSQSPAGHIQNDSGTLLIGTRGRWIITDPGYQQYMEDEEREFTIGPTAHNCPVIHGFAQDRKGATLRSLETVSPTLQKTVLDLSRCYPEEAGVRSLRRTVWLSERDLVVVADQIDSEHRDPLVYHWHGNPDAGWWSERGWVLVHCAQQDLWFTSPQASLQGGNIHRLPGSRGQLTLVAEVDGKSSQVWWVFLLREKPEAIRMAGDAQSLEVLGRRFSL